MIRPLANRILVKLLPRYDSKIPIVLVDNQKHYQGTRTGVVLYVGDQVREVRPGDKILFSGDSGESFSYENGSMTDGTEWRRLREKDVMAVEEVET